MADRTIRQRLLDGEVVIGTFQVIGSPEVAEITGLAGLDFTILDQEHGPLSTETCLALCTAAEAGGAAPIVRVQENARPQIQRALDIGAAGVQIPQIETKTDAQRAVANAHYGPVGERGLSLYVRSGGYKGGDEYTDLQNEQTALIVQIEGERGVENLDAIMEVEGIDVLFLGPYDLSQSIGIPGRVNDERVEELMSDVSERAREADRVVGTYADTPEMARRWIEAGVQYVAVYVDAPTLLDAFASMRSAIEE